MIKFKNKFRIASARLPGWDYHSPGLYFVTICTKDKQHYFGEFRESTVETDNYPSLQLTNIGSIAQKHWQEIPRHFPFVELDAFVIMPNHIHGVLLINPTNEKPWEPNRFAPQSKNLPSIIRGYKASVKKLATLNNIPFAWQSRYFDRIVRNDTELQNIRQYIFNDPIKWMDDMNKSKNLLM